jgi:hypothetical protein
MHRISAELLPECLTNIWKIRIVITCIVQQSNIKSIGKTLVDSRATKIKYILGDLACSLSLREKPLPYIIYPTVFTGTVLDSEEVSHNVTLKLQHDNHVKSIRLYVTNTNHHELILCQPWKNKHQVNTDYANEKMLFTA